MRGQISLFLIVGLVLAISVVILIFISQSATPNGAVDQIENRNLSPEVCLQRGLTSSLASLQNDGVITEDERGQLPVGNYTYLKNSSVFRQGMVTYYGLCDQATQADLDDGTLCYPSVYTTTNLPSIQTQLDHAITNHTRTCLNTTDSEVEVYIQRDAVQAVLSNPQAQASQQLPVTSIWAAISVFLEQQSSNLTYDGADEIKACDFCRNVTVDKNNKVSIDSLHYDNYTFGTQEFSVNILLEDRDILWQSSEPGDFVTTSLEFNGLSGTHTFYAPDGDDITATSGTLTKDGTIFTYTCEPGTSNTLSDPYGNSIEVNC